MGKLTCVVWEDEFPGCCWSCCLSGVQAVPLSVSSLISTLGLLAKAKQCLECTTIASVTVALLSLPVQRTPIAFLLLHTVEKISRT